MLRHYPVVIHKDKDSDYGICVPDLPGCFSAGSSVTEALAQIKEAIECHLEGLLLDDEEMPAPTADYSALTDNPEYAGGIWHLVEIDLSKLDTRTRRINITIPERLLTQVDRFVKDHRLGSRSGFLAQAAETFIEHHR
ncbi:MAG: type II toxin-antitoxin system HicB family antitoxin [Deltaproteobacteria bacterium]|nr:type II toxin-antitoxin system HicB family antitoxin [Deltaproteobacteria bacterium]